MQNTYAKAPLRGAFGYAKCIFDVIFVKSFGDAENNQNKIWGLKHDFGKVMQMQANDFLSLMLSTSSIFCQPEMLDVKMLLQMLLPRWW